MDQDMVLLGPGPIITAISDPYDPARTYVEGEYRSVDGKLYKAKGNITTPEQWTPEHWIRVKLTGELSEEQTRLTNVVNGTLPPALAENLTTDSAQHSAQEFILRTSGGAASIHDGPAWISLIMGNRIHTGYIPESIEMNIIQEERQEVGNLPISAVIDKEVFREAVSQDSGTITFTYNGSTWSLNPETYGITISGNPENGDEIDVVYSLEVRGTIINATPTEFISTGWNLYRGTAAGFAKVHKYSDEYGFLIGGTYTALGFTTTVGGSTTPITPVDGFFNVPSDGYIYVTGGGSDTYIINTWSDWQEGPVGDYKPYEQFSISIASVMNEYFQNGLLRVGNIRDEINFNSQLAISRIESISYTKEYLEQVIASGRNYEYDETHIYVVRGVEEVHEISVSTAYTANDHGIEWFTATSVPVYAEVLYGSNLKNKLERDVLTISQQTLSSGEKTQVRTNISAASASDLSDLNSKIDNEVYYKPGDNVAIGSSGWCYALSACRGDFMEVSIILPKPLKNTSHLAFTNFSTGSSLYLVINNSESWRTVKSIESISFKNGTNQIAFNLTIQDFNHIGPAILYIPGSTIIAIS